MLRQIMTLVIIQGFFSMTAAAEQAKRGPASIAPSISFAEYAAENAGNPAMNRKIADHQTAFVDGSRAAIITLPPEAKDPTEAPPPAAAQTGTQPQSTAGQSGPSH